MTAMTGNGPICAACGKLIDIDGPAVSSHPQRDNPDGPWTAFWVPFVEDLRGTPTRLVQANAMWKHMACLH
jgi:hypothetical protein